MIDYQIIEEICKQEFRRLINYYDSLDIDRNPNKFQVPFEESFHKIIRLYLETFPMNLATIPIEEYPKAFSLKYGTPEHIIKDHSKYTCRTCIGTSGYFVFYRDFSKCRILNSHKGIRFDNIPFPRTIAPEIYAEFLFSFENIRNKINQGPSFQDYLDYISHRKAKFDMVSKIHEITNTYKHA